MRGFQTKQRFISAGFLKQNLLLAMQNDLLNYDDLRTRDAQETRQNDDWRKENDDDRNKQNRDRRIDRQEKRQSSDCKPTLCFHLLDRCHESLSQAIRVPDNPRHLAM
jgi:hypothetical protein